MRPFTVMENDDVQEALDPGGLAGLGLPQTLIGLWRELTEHAERLGVALPDVPS
ncbi:hypothetical protein [Streptomyces sp. NPDC057616]|uniref:hypothetical protein n=1 Tax=Streptomyces sp. NPDC057616 TaxID=3346183 RepID=UPI0036A8014D